MLMTEGATMARNALPLIGADHRNQFEGSKRDVGERIRSLRDAKGLSQLDLAKLLDKSRSAVAQWEVGNALPDLMDYRRIANFLGSTPQFIAFGIADQNQGVSVPRMDYSESAAGRQVGQMSLDDDFVKRTARAASARLRAVTLTESPIRLTYDSCNEGDIVIIDESNKKIQGSEGFLMFERVPVFARVSNVPGDPDMVAVSFGRNQSVTVSRKAASSAIVGRVVATIKSER